MTRVRLHNSCVNRCRFCNDADALDDTPIPWASVEAALGVAEHEVGFTGGECTLSPHLLRALRAARSRGLRTTLTTSGRTLTTDSRVRAVRDAGLDTLRVSLHGAQPTTHDGLVGHPGAWVQSLAAVRIAGELGLPCVVHAVLVAENAAEIGEMVRQAANLDATAFQLRSLQHAGAARTAVGLAPTPRQRDRALALAHAAAAGRRIRLDLHGFDEADLAAAVRDGLARTTRTVWDLALERAARGEPFEDLPPCLGGVATATDDPVKADACRACPLDAACPGVPRDLENRFGLGGVRPHPWWLDRYHPKVAVLLGSGLLAVQAEAVGAALRAAGALVQVAASPADLFPGVELLVCQPDGLRHLPDGATPVVIDDRLDAPVLSAGWAVSPFRGLAARYAGGLGRVHFRPLPVDSARFTPAGPGRGIGYLGASVAADALYRSAAAAAIVVVDAEDPADVVLAATLALAAGRPVVTRPTPAVLGLLDHQRNGWLTADPAAEAAAILRDPGRLTALTTGALTTIPSLSLARWARHVVAGRPPRHHFQTL